jgi:hypothetical protein
MMYIAKDRGYFFALDGWVTEINESVVRFPSREEAELCIKVRKYDLNMIDILTEEEGHAWVKEQAEKLKGSDNNL